MDPKARTVGVGVCVCDNISSLTHTLVSPPLLRSTGPEKFVEPSIPGRPATPGGHLRVQQRAVIYNILYVKYSGVVTNHSTASRSCDVLTPNQCRINFLYLLNEIHILTFDLTALYTCIMNIHIRVNVCSAFCSIASRSRDILTPNQCRIKFLYLLNEIHILTFDLTALYTL